MTKFSAYSSQQIDAARVWPAIDQYLKILSRPFDPSDKVVALKRKRHEAWLESAIASFQGETSDEEICRAWSNAADINIREAYELSGLSKTDVAVFALGKLGAQELNLSSDIDLMFVTTDESGAAEASAGGSAMKRAAQEFIRILSENDEWGFVHRVDVALRPGGSSSALIPTLSQFENHYGYQGEAWERLAFVRFRHICGGSESLRKQAADFARGFSYRRHLDYSVIDELRFLIHRIRGENPAISNSEFQLKLHPGGIRDIELFVHALQTIHGGRRKTLQTNRTSEAIERLVEAGLLSKDDGQTLYETYWFYRKLENRLQGENDEQTYRLAEPKVVAQVKDRAQRIIAISESTFPQMSKVDVPTPIDLAARGFSESVATESLKEIQETRILSKKSERDEREKNIFLSGFLTSLEKSGGDLDLGLGLLVDFIKTTRAKATLFSMLNREPVLVLQLATLFGVSPWAGQVLCSRPELLDAFILRQEASDISNLDIDQALEALSERRMIGEVIAVLHFLESKDLETCVANLTSLADSIASDLMKLTAAELGCDPVEIVALGKWGGREMGLRSDLDFVFLTSKPAGSDQQRLARRFLNRMTESHRGGSIYSVDLRLRPSGHAGPMLVEGDRLIEHLKNSAAAWERQSWLRARFIDPSSSALAASRVLIDIHSAILKRGLSSEDESELAEISNRLFKPIPILSGLTSEKKPTIDLKLVHGGLAPIEFAAQIEILRSGPTTGLKNLNLLETSTRGMLHFLEGIETSSPARVRLLRNLQTTHAWLRQIEQWVRVTGDVSGSSLNLGSKEFLRFAKTSGESAESFPQILLSKLVDSSESLNVLLGRSSDR